MLRAMYTPETINKDEFHRHIFLWYGRVDATAAILAGEEAKLSREWYVASEACSAQQLAASPDDFKKKVWMLRTRLCRIGMDMAALFAKTSRNLINTDDLRAENEQLSASLDLLGRDLKAVQDPRCLVMFYPQRKALGPDDVFNPYLPGILYDEPIWEVNYMSLEVLATILMHRHHTGLALQQQDHSQTHNLAIEQCRLIEAMTRWPSKRKELPVAVRSSLGIAIMFLPHDHAHIMWSRRKLAWLEQQGGYVEIHFYCPVQSHFW
jgi:hypothetical protein